LGLGKGVINIYGVSGKGREYYTLGKEYGGEGKVK